MFFNIQTVDSVQGTFQMKKLIYIVLVMTAIVACSDHTQTTVDDTLPEYDTVSYCQKFAGHFKKYGIQGEHHFNKIFNDCLQEEKSDYKWLKAHWNLVPSKLKIHCKQAVNTSRENYGVLKGCSFAAICFEDREDLKICAERRKQK